MFSNLVQMSNFVRNSVCGIWSGSDSSMSLSVEDFGRFSRANCLSDFRFSIFSGTIFLALYYYYRIG